MYVNKTQGQDEMQNENESTLKLPRSENEAGVAGKLCAMELWEDSDECTDDSLNSTEFRLLKSRRKLF